MARFLQAEVKRVNRKGRQGQAAKYAKKFRIGARTARCEVLRGVGIRYAGIEGPAETHESRKMRRPSAKYPKIAGTASPLRLRRSEGPKLPPGRTGSFTSGSRWIQLSRRYRHDLSTHPDSAGAYSFVSEKSQRFSARVVVEFCVAHGSQNDGRAVSGGSGQSNGRSWRVLPGRCRVGRSQTCPG